MLFNLCARVNSRVRVIIIVIWIRIKIGNSTPFIKHTTLHLWDDLMRSALKETFLPYSHNRLIISDLKHI